MIIFTRFLRHTFFILFTLLSCQYAVWAANGVNLYTPYTKITVPPGESIDYSIDVINKGSTIKNVGIALSGMPEGWDYTLKSGGWAVSQIAVLPGEKKTLSLQVKVPQKVDKGNHRFRVVASNYDVLPLTVNVSEQGTFKTEFTCKQANMEGHAKSTFNFNAELDNQTGEKQLYSLRANAPRGWSVMFKPNHKQATAVEVEPNKKANITIDVKPPHNIQAGTYKIPVRATTRATTADLELEVVITGSFDLNLTTPTGLLSSSVTAGSTKKIELLIVNTGSSTLDNIRLSASKPKNWEVSFEPDTVNHLEPGGKAIVNASIKADDKAIPGDYVVNLTAQTPEATSKSTFRILVKTPLLWGWLGILVIAVALGGVYYLFQKYGRR